MIDKNPEILMSLLRPIGAGIHDVLGPEGVVNQALKPGGAVSSLADNVGRIGTTALGKDSTLTPLTSGVGETAREALGPGGPVKELTRGIGDVASGVANVLPP